MKTSHSLIAAGLRPALAIVTQRIAFPLLCLGAGLLLAQPCASAPFEFEETGSLITGRDFHTATLLPNGKVLVAGGEASLGIFSRAQNSMIPRPEFGPLPAASLMRAKVTPQRCYPMARSSSQEETRVLPFRERRTL